MANDVGGWPDINFDADPQIILGLRAGARRLDGRRVDVHQDAFADLRAVCEPVVAQLQQAVPRGYEPFAQLETAEEYFRVEIDELPQRPPRRRRVPSEEAASGNDEQDTTTDLVRLVRWADQLPPVRNLDDFAYIFYAICWRNDDSVVAFIKKTDPRRALKRGRRWFQYGDALRRSAAPDLVLEPDVDVVVTAEFVAALNPTAFKTLLSDVQVALAGVSADVKAVRERLQHVVPLSNRAAEALEQAARRRVSYARRLNLLSDRIGALTLDKAKVRTELRAVGVPTNTLLDRSGRFDFGVEEAGVFLDVLEARYFDDRLGGERRRADRYSTRA